MKKLRQLGAIDASNMAITGRHVVTKFDSVHLSRVVQQHLKRLQAITPFHDLCMSFLMDIWHEVLSYVC